MTMKKILSFLLMGFLATQFCQAQNTEATPIDHVNVVQKIDLNTCDVYIVPTVQAQPKGGYQPADIDASADGAGWWWGWAPEEIQDPDGGNSTMTFQLAGTKIVKESGSGTIKFNMTPTNTCNIGTITTTGAGILYPYKEDDEGVNQRGAKCESFEILRLTEQEIVLCADCAGTGAWGRSTYWRFRAK